MSDFFLRLLLKLSRRGDLVIAILMLVAVIMLLIPLPTFLVDILITANISISVLVLLVCFYISHPLEFSSLPSVILITTLFRLAITITTTRLILLQADAGAIIATFGMFVVGGSIAVGLIIFLIITVAQFIVVAKGSERVAEVAARFTLDALPGKQMSIDAELRSGDIDQAEARRLRHQLGRESQLFGAMDGAMKFVKGDVIAGIVIILVNLVGGLAVGILQHGMSFSEAASIYTLLTVGDGLVAQIPALLVAIASGTMVTRVAGADGQGDLGGQITGQLTSEPRALALAAAVLIGLSLVPGFPTLVFLALGSAFGAGAYAIHQRKGATAIDGSTTTAASEQHSAPRPLSLGSIDASKATSRIEVRLGVELGTAIPEPEFAQMAGRIRGELYADLGVNVPAIGHRVDHALAPRHIRIDLEGAPILEATIPPHDILVEADVDNLDLLGVSYEKGPSIAGQRNTIWINAQYTDSLKKAGLRFFVPTEIAGKWLGYMLRRYAGHFVGIQETRKLLSDMEADYADLVREAQEAVPLQKIAEVLRRLVAENVPIQNLRLILEAVVEWSQREQDVALLTEYVRIALKRQISFRSADRNNVIAAYVLEQSAEEVLRNAVHPAAAGPFLDIYHDGTQSLVVQLERATSQTSVGVLPVVLAAMDVRRHLRSLLVHNGIELPVLSYQELAPEYNVQPLATVAAVQSGRPDRDYSQISSSTQAISEQTTAS